MEQNDAEELVARAARKIEQLLRKRSAALEVRLTPLTVTKCQFEILHYGLKAVQEIFTSATKKTFSICFLVGHCRHEYVHSITKVYVVNRVFNPLFGSTAGECVDALNVY